MDIKTKYKNKAVKIMFIILFIIYFLMVLYITLLPIPTQPYEIALWKEYPLVNNINLVPFVNSMFENTLIQTAGNIIMFMPFGFLLPFMNRSIKFKYVLICTLLASVFIELPQLLLCLMVGVFFRVVDIDDLILNTTGGVMGYLIYFLENKILINTKLGKYLY